MRSGIVVPQTDENEAGSPRFMVVNPCRAEEEQDPGVVLTPFFPHGRAYEEG